MLQKTDTYCFGQTRDLVLSPQGKEGKGVVCVGGGDGEGGQKPICSTSVKDELSFSLGA